MRMTAALALMLPLGLAGCGDRPASTAQAPSVPARLHALGTEPFWSLRIEGTTLAYTTPEDSQGRRGAVTRRDIPGAAVFSGRLGDAAIRVEVSQRECSDGMSDRTYPFAVALALGAERRLGCAS